jgi:hypothetical protein
VAFFVGGEGGAHEKLSSKIRKDFGNKFRISPPSPHRVAFSLVIGLFVYTNIALSIEKIFFCVIIM